VRSGEIPAAEADRREPSPLLSNIYLHVLDSTWERRCAHLGTLVGHADDFVVLCNMKKKLEEAVQRVHVILERIGLQLHPGRR